MQARSQITAGRETKRLFRSWKFCFLRSSPGWVRTQSRQGPAEQKLLRLPLIPQVWVLRKPFSSAGCWRHPGFLQTWGLHHPKETPSPASREVPAAQHPGWSQGCPLPCGNPSERGFCCPGGVSPSNPQLQPKAGLPLLHNLHHLHWLGLSVCTLDSPHQGLCLLPGLGTAPH